jgi:hypothetical protein
MEARASAAESAGRTFQKLRGTNPKKERALLEREAPFFF